MLTLYSCTIGLLMYMCKLFLNDVITLQTDPQTPSISQGVSVQIYLYKVGCENSMT